MVMKMETECPNFKTHQCFKYREVGIMLTTNWRRTGGGRERRGAEELASWHKSANVSGHRDYRNPWGVWGVLGPKSTGPGVRSGVRNMQGTLLGPRRAGK